MAMARVYRVTMPNRKDKPHPEAVLVDEGRVFTNTGEPITHWEIEINTFDDLKRIAGDEQVILTYNEAGVASITFYDDYIE